MSLRIEKTKSEWMVAKRGLHGTAVHAYVENGAVQRVRVYNLCTNGEGILTDIDRLRDLYEATREILEEVKASQERTRPPENP